MVEGYLKNHLSLKKTNPNISTCILRNLSSVLSFTLLSEKLKKKNLKKILFYHYLPVWINIKVLYSWSHCSWSWLIEGVGFVCGKTPSSDLLRLCEWAKTYCVAMQPASSFVRWGIWPTLWFSNLVFSTGTLCAKSDLSPDKAQQFPLPCDGLKSSSHFHWK